MSKASFFKTIQQKHLFLIIALGFITYLFIFIKPPYFGVLDPPFWATAERFSWHRPITLLVFKCVSHLFKLNSIGYFFMGVGLHLCNAILVYNLVMPLVREDKIALTTAAFFLVHFISADTVLQIYHLSMIIAGFFYLISILCFMKSLVSTRFKIIFYTLSLISCLLALGARETALSLPFVILFYNILFVRDSIYPRFKTMVYRYIPYFVITIIIIVFVGFNQWDNFHLSQRFNMVRHNFSGLVTNFSILTEALFIPFNFQDASNNFWLTNNHNFIISLLIVVSLMLLMFFCKSKICKFSLMWIVVTIMPFLPRQVNEKELYLYLPLIGACLLVSVLIQEVGKKLEVLIKNKGVVFLFQNSLIVMILFLFFASSWGRIISRQRVGEISREMLATVNSSISVSERNILIYAVCFPGYIDRFLIGSRSASRIAFLSDRKNAEKIDSGKIFASINCYLEGKGNPLEFKESMYALALTKTVGNLKVDGWRSYGFYQYPLFNMRIDKVSSEIIGIDSLFQQRFDRYVFYYRDGKVIDLTGRVFPKCKVVFKVKGRKIKKISITGDFNYWDRKDYFLVNSEGAWQKEILASPGKYLYKLIINDDKEISNPNSEYSVNDDARGLCSILVVSNNALPIGLLPSGDDRYDAQVIKTKERLLINPDDVYLHKELAGLYAQKGFLKEAGLEYIVTEELNKKR